MPEKKPPTSPSVAQLAQLADAEATALKERHRAREQAVRSYVAATAAVTEAETAIAHAKADQGAAIAALVDSGLGTTAVARVLGLTPGVVAAALSAARKASKGTAVEPPSPAVPRPKQAGAHGSPPPTPENSSGHPAEPVGRVGYLQ